MTPGLLSRTTRNLVTLSVLAWSPHAGDALEVTAPFRQHIESTTFKHFGPSRFDINASGAPLVWFDEAQSASLCHHDPNVDLAGAVVITTMWSGCEIGIWYRRLERMGALAMVGRFSTDPPGFGYYYRASSASHSGAMPWMDVCMPELTNALEYHERGVSINMQLRPTRNRWLSLESKPLFIFCIRSMSPSFAAVTALRAARGLWRRHRRSTQRQDYALNLILWLELVACAVLALNWFINFAGWMGDSLPSSFKLFCASWFSGAGIFTSFVSAMFWREIEVSANHQQKRRNIFASHRWAILAVFMVTAVPETLASALFANFLYWEWAKYLLVAGFLVHVPVTVFLVTKVGRVGKTIRGAAAVSTGTSQEPACPYQSQLHYVASCLGLSGFLNFVFLLSIVLQAIVMISRDGVKPMYAWVVIRTIGFIGRIGTGYAQVPGT